jgi:predicted transcriptional regulator
MVGKRVKFDDETWAALEAVASESGRSFQEVADEAFADFLKKHKQPVGLRAALKESVAEKPQKKRKR